MTKRESTAATGRIDIDRLRELAEEAVTAAGLETQWKIAEALAVRQPTLSKAFNPAYGVRYRGILIDIVNRFHPDKRIEGEELMFTVVAAARTK